MTGYSAQPGAAQIGHFEPGDAAATAPAPAPGPAPVVQPPSKPILVDALDRSFVPTQPVEWSLLDIILNLNMAGSFTLQMAATDQNWNLIQFDSNGDFVPFPLFVDWHGVWQGVLLAEDYEYTLAAEPTTGVITETITLTGTDMMVLLANRVAYPDGTQQWTAQTTVPVPYPSGGGTAPAETVIKDIVSANTVNAGDTARQIPSFVVATDQGRGAATSYTVVPPLPQSYSNSLTGDNSTFDGSVGTWVALTNCTVAHAKAKSSYALNAGPGSMLITASATGDMIVASCAAANVLTDGINVRAGDSISATSWFIAATTLRNVAVGVNWYDDTGTQIGSTTWSASHEEQVFNGNPDWGSPASLSATAPSNAVLAILLLKIESPASGEQHWTDTASFSDGGNGTTITPQGALGASLLDVIRTIYDTVPMVATVTPDTSTGKIVFDVAPPRDLSQVAVFATTLGNLRGIDLTDSSPSADVILAQSGVASAPFSLVTTSGDQAPADAFRRAEQFLDETSTTATAQVKADATSALASGAAQRTLTIQAVDIPGLQFGTPSSGQGYGLGDKVTVEIRDGITYTDVVSSVELTASTTGYASIPYPMTTQGVFTQSSIPHGNGGMTAGSSYIEFVTPTIGTANEPNQTDKTATAALAATVARIQKQIQRLRKSGQ